MTATPNKMELWSSRFAAVSERALSARRQAPVRPLTDGVRRNKGRWLEASAGRSSPATRSSRLTEISDQDDGRRSAASVVPFPLAREGVEDALSLEADLMRLRRTLGWSQKEPAF